MKQENKSHKKYIEEELMENEKIGYNDKCSFIQNNYIISFNEIVNDITNILELKEKNIEPLIKTSSIYLKNKSTIETLNKNCFEKIKMITLGAISNASENFFEENITKIITKIKKKNETYNNCYKNEDTLNFFEAIKKKFKKLKNKIDDYYKNFTTGQFFIDAKKNIENSKNKLPNEFLEFWEKILKIFIEFEKKLYIISKKIEILEKSFKNF